MRTRRSRNGGVLAAVLCVGVLAGCAPGGSGGGGAPTSGASSTESATRSAESGAAIEDPKDLGAVSDACTLLTERQLGELGMNAEPTYKEAMLGIKSCDWDGDRFAFTIIPDTKSGGIDELYETDNHGRGLERTELAGHPAALIGRTDLTCRAEVGVSADASFGVDYVVYDNAEKGTACEGASEIAAMVLKNIPDA